MKPRVVLALLLGALLLFAVAPAALAALTVTRAELNGGQLRVEGQGAPNATVTVDGVAMGTAASDGRFRIDRAGFSSPTCVITVSDGTTSVQATLSGCTPAGTSPPPPASTPTASFRGLGQLPGWTSSQAWGVSGDGMVVVGQVSKLGSAMRAFRWTAAGGMEDLGTLGGDNSEAYEASRDGSVVVGRATNLSGNYRPFRWTPSGGMQDLGTTPPEWLSGHALDVSADGSIAVGLFGQAERWSASAGLADLGSFSARGVSPEGAVVVGATTHAVRWTPSGGLQDLGTVGGTESFADAASANGSVVVGQSRDKDMFWKAFRWTAASGMQDLRTLGGPMAAAYDVSGDGSVVVGRSLSTASSASDRAFPLDDEEADAGPAPGLARPRRQRRERLDPARRDRGFGRRHSHRRGGSEPRQGAGGFPRRVAAPLDEAPSAPRAAYRPDRGSARRFACTDRRAGAGRHSSPWPL